MNHIWPLHTLQISSYPIILYSFPSLPGPKSAVQLLYRDARRDNGTRRALLQDMKLVLILTELRSMVIDVKKTDGNRGKGAAISCPPGVICYNLSRLKGTKSVSLQLPVFHHILSRTKLSSKRALLIGILEDIRAGLAS